MSSPLTEIYLRASRDRVVDLLGLGETHPLQDVDVMAEGLTVPIDTTAKIPLLPGQSDCLYLLHDMDEQPVSSGPGTPGTGEATLVESPALTEDVTYKILARKVDTGREAWLHETATVKVGLDLSLAARIRAATLDQTIETPADADVRIVDFGTSVEVEVDATQEGVDYRLVRVTGSGEDVLSVDDVRGDLHRIVLTTRPVDEDVELRIRATKTFDPADGREAQTGLLDTVLPLRVRADPALAVTADPMPVIPFQTGTAITVAGTQASVTYQLWGRTLSDRDFVYGAVGELDVERVPVTGQPDVQVLVPPRSAVWEVPVGFIPLGDPQQGTGSELRFDLTVLIEDGLTEDSQVMVTGQKEHLLNDAGDLIASEVRLERTAVVLVEPDPSPALALWAPAAGAALTGMLRVSGGQPGVFYSFRPGEDGTEHGWPAYSHKLDELDSELNKGVGQLRLGVDFVVTRSQEAAGDPARLRPLPPLLEIGALPLDATLYVRAMKARTRVGVPVTATAAVPALPEVRLEQETVDFNATATIRVVASLPGEQYRLFRDGEPVGEAQDGNGADLTFESAPLTEDAAFELQVRRPGDPGIPTTRAVELTVTVQPEPVPT